MQKLTKTYENLRRLRKFMAVGFHTDQIRSLKWQSDSDSTQTRSDNSKYGPFAIKKRVTRTPNISQITEITYSKMRF